MKKIYLILLVIFILGAIGLITFSFLVLNFTTNLKQDNSKIISVKNASYMINGQLVTLVNGLSETSDDSGSSSKMITRYFGNEAFGDLNGDGKTDTAFLLTQETGGSGVFFYITAALANDNGYQGLNAILLGDRIAPQTTKINEGKIVVNYADRKIDESFAVSPSIGVSKYFQVINNQLTEIKASTVTPN